jgi:hypothetical protein
MASLSDKQAAEYFRRCYTAVDGLWFLKTEARYDFDTALAIDEQVWNVLPKIQARALKSMLEAPAGLDGLRDCLATRLALEGFAFDLGDHRTGFEIVIHRCPWHDLMVKSSRANLSATVGQRICQTEYAVWAAEFGDIRFERFEGICEGGGRCGLRFTVARDETTAVESPPPELSAPPGWFTGPAQTS